jgi:hypothetical protein
VRGGPALMDLPIEQVDPEAVAQLRAALQDEDTDDRLLEPDMLAAVVQLLGALLGPGLLREIFADPSAPDDRRLRRLLTRCHPDRAGAGAKAQADALTDLMGHVRQLLGHAVAGPAIGHAWAQLHADPTPSSRPGSPSDFTERRDDQEI